MCAAPFQLGVKVGGDACCLLQLSQQNIPLLLLQDPVGRFTSMYKKSRVQCMASHISRQACVTAHCVLILQDKLGYECGMSLQVGYYYISNMVLLVCSDDNCYLLTQYLLNNIKVHLTVNYHSDRQI